MERVTLTTIKNMVKVRLAEDITHYDFDRVNALLRSRDLDRIAYSCGTYGITGAVLRDMATGDLFCVTARNSTLFQVL